MMKTAKDLELSLLLKESHNQQLKLKIEELNELLDKKQEECKYWKNQYMQANNASVDVATYIEHNFTNPDGSIWHDAMKRIYNMLGWYEDEN